MGAPPRPTDASRLTRLIASVRDFARRHRTLITIVGSLATAAVLLLVLAGHHREFATAFSEATTGVLAGAALLWMGLTVLRTLRAGSRVIGLVLVAVFAQIARNWLLLRAVGVDASVFDATAVLIALSTLQQLPVGPGAGAAAAVLILGSDGVAAAAAAGVLTTVTGTVGGLCFAAWAGADKLWSISRWSALHRRDRAQPPRSR